MTPTLERGDIAHVRRGDAFRRVRRERLRASLNDERSVGERSRGVEYRAVRMLDARARLRVRASRSPQHTRRSCCRRRGRRRGPDSPDAGRSTIIRSSFLVESSFWLVQLLRCGQLHLCQGSGSVSSSLSSGSCWSATVGTVPPPTQALLFARPAVWASRRVRAFLRRLSSVLPPFCNQKERCIPPP